MYGLCRIPRCFKHHGAIKSLGEHAPLTSQHLAEEAPSGQIHRHRESVPREICQNTRVAAVHAGRWVPQSGHRATDRYARPTTIIDRMVGDKMSQPDLSWLRAERDSIRNNLHLQAEP